MVFLSSMTTIADLNDKWAAYAGPGGWNGKIFVAFLVISANQLIPEPFLFIPCVSFMDRPRYAGSWQWWHDFPGISWSL